MVVASITQSSFDCYNKCLKDAKCVFAIHKAIESAENCFLKYEALGNNGTAPNSEYIKITSKIEMSFEKFTKILNYFFDCRL